MSFIYLFIGQVNIKSLEDVVRAYLKLAEEKTEAAKEESQQMVLDIEDLDNIQTPERYVGLIAKCIFLNGDTCDSIVPI